jgi:hypothetical protein
MNHYLSFHRKKRQEKEPGSKPVDTELHDIYREEAKEDRPILNNGENWQKLQSEITLDLTRLKYF